MLHSPIVSHSHTPPLLVFAHSPPPSPSFAMTTIVDLPEEIYILIAKHLTIRSLHSCIRTCHSFYSSFIPHLWPYVHLSTLELESTIPPAHVRANAHHIKSVSLHPVLTEEYYNIVFPRLQKLKMDNYSSDSTSVDYLTVKPLHKVLFVRQHPFVRKLVYRHKDLLPKEFWEIIGATWTRLEVLEFEGTVEEGVEDAFLGVCDRVQDLSLTSVDFSGYNNALASLSTLSFRRLCRVKVEQQRWRTKEPYQEWPLRLLESVKRSQKLTWLCWNVSTAAFPFQMVQDAFMEACWPELCEFCIGKFICSEEDLTRILTMLPSRRLTSFVRDSEKFSSLTFNCLRDHYFGHLRELDLGRCSSVTSAMVQEVMTECVHLVVLDAFHVFVRDVATAQKPWVCLGLERLTLYFAKQRGDAAEWEGLVFQQISRLCRLLMLNLRRDPHFTLFDDEPRSNVIMDLKTLDLRLPRNSDRNGLAGSCQNGGSSSGSDDIRCWSSLARLITFSFDADRHTLGMDELVWMIENWRDLRHVDGEFKAIEGEECTRRDRILREADLEVEPWDI
ncbi:MAG: hypothetical protein JOS17DRAFT_762034 [Linnemannia elongata]|nr:MAG: hypothetical protein JOS17DRAFT_762034 [Linnemannia elongata]